MEKKLIESTHVFYQRGFKYQTTEDFYIKVEIRSPKILKTGKFIKIKNGWLIIEAGYAWDGASGPTIDTPSSYRGSLVHDALYQLLRAGVLDSSWREYADNLFTELCKDDGMWHWRADGWHWGVEEFAGGASKPKNKRIS